MKLLESLPVLICLILFAIAGCIFAFLSFSDISTRAALRAELAALDPQASPDETVVAARRYLQAPVRNIDPEATAWALGQYEKALRRKLMLNASQDDASSTAALGRFNDMRTVALAAIEEARK